jgi:hypothetical protein
MSALSVWLLVYLVAYTMVRIPFYGWYLVPAYPVTAIFAANGIGVMTRMANRIKELPRWAYISFVALILLALIAPYAWHGYGHVAGWKRYLLSLEKSRVSVGDWLRDHTPSESTVYAGAIGHIGYVSNRHIIDGAGLITPPYLKSIADPDYFVLSSPVNKKRCGPVKEVDTGWPSYPRITISRCSEVKAAFDTLVLAEVRITDWVRGENEEWYEKSQPHLETQWYLRDGRPKQDWTLYVHFTHPDGTTVAQADHLLGRKSDGSTLPTTQWPVEQRVYDYVPLPKEISQSDDRVQVRLGVWEPSSGERLEPGAVHANRDKYGRLVVTLAGLD